MTFVKLLKESPVGCMCALCRGVDPTSIKWQWAGNVFCQTCGEKLHIIKGGKTDFSAPSCLCETGWEELKRYVDLLSTNKQILRKLATSNIEVALMLIQWIKPMTEFDRVTCFHNLRDRLYEAIIEAFEEDPSQKENIMNKVCNWLHHEEANYYNLIQIAADVIWNKSKVN